MTTSPIRGAHLAAKRWFASPHHGQLRRRHQTLASTLRHTQRVRARLAPYLQTNLPTLQGPHA